MAQKNRKTLKSYFKRGAMPSAENFAHLIDSTLNIEEEGIEKTKSDGFKISSFLGMPNLFSLYKGRESSDDPVCRIGLEHGENQLRISSTDEAALLNMDLSNNFVGINQPKPAHALDVAGVVASKGRVGTYQQGGVPADGGWHPITEPLYGCHGFEVIAGVGLKKSGKYALLQAVALNTHNPKGLFFNWFGSKNRVNATQAYYRSRLDKIQLRWTELDEGDLYRLEIKTNSSYGEGIQVRYQMTQLWFDPEMSLCQEPVVEND